MLQVRARSFVSAHPLAASLLYMALRRALGRARGRARPNPAGCGEVTSPLFSITSILNATSYETGRRDWLKPEFEVKEIAELLRSIGISAAIRSFWFPWDTVFLPSTSAAPALISPARLANSKRGRFIS